MKRVSSGRSVLAGRTAAPARIKHRPSGLGLPTAWGCHHDADVTLKHRECWGERGRVQSRALGERAGCLEWHHVVIKLLGCGVSDLGLNPCDVLIAPIYLVLSASPPPKFFMFVSPP